VKLELPVFSLTKSLYL